MKIVDRKAFLELPAGTFYAKIPERWVHGGVEIKRETVAEVDWYTQDLSIMDWDSDGDFVDKLEDMAANGASYPVNESAGRDGLFDQEDLFLIYERADLEKLRGWVDEALKVEAS